ncbi:MAG: cytochrome c family protein [Alphaproteobacteria bacterium]|nr:cytochrome c family protein [Alphaproteobacteria bacterium]
MDSFTINKIIGAVLGTFLLLFAVNIVSEELFPGPESHGSEHADAEAGGDSTASSEAEAPEAEEISLAAALAAGNAEDGAKVFKKCAACHSVDAAAGNKIGPNLHGVVGRKVASVDGFSYSSAVVEFGGEWTDERLSLYLANPKQAIPGNKMAFAGLKKPTDRADVILYLRESSPGAPPLPKE